MYASHVTRRTIMAEIMALPKTCSAVVVFQRSSEQLLDAISEPIPLAWKLYGKGIISDKTLQDVQVPGQPDYRMNATILEAVRKAIKTKEELVMEFFDAMDQQPLADRIVAKMRSDMSRFRFGLIIIIMR